MTSTNALTKLQKSRAFRFQIISIHRGFQKGLKVENLDEKILILNCDSLSALVKLRGQVRSLSSLRNSLSSPDPDSPLLALLQKPTVQSFFWITNTFSNNFVVYFELFFESEGHNFEKANFTFLAVYFLESWIETRSLILYFESCCWPASRKMITLSIFSSLCFTLWNGYYRLFWKKYFELTARLHFSYPLKIPIFTKKGMNLENLGDSFVDPILYRYCALSSLVSYKNIVCDHLSPHSSCYLQEDVSVLATSFRNSVTKAWK